MKLLQRIFSLGFFWLRDIIFPSYCESHSHLNLVFPKLELNGTYLKSLETSSLICLYYNHYFDILGSGWRQWNIAETFTNKVNRSNRRYSAYLKKQLSPSYLSINWNTDIRYGFSWDSSTWSRFIQPAKPLGVDIKIPWEIARMQHLPFIALFDLYQSTVHETVPEKAAQEFQNQIIDFISNCPPRFGVNWRTPMDVSIRAVNWILTYNICNSFGYRFNEVFNTIISRSLFDHGRNIVEFIEWDPQWRANHYLANVCGLVFIAATLDDCEETNEWLAYGIQELISECLRQVQEDGSVFEASTGYHRLSIEMIVFTTATVLGLISLNKEHRFLECNSRMVKFPRPLQDFPFELYPLPGNANILTPFSNQYFQRLQKALEFTKAITKPDGNTILIGDNDSGRFVRLEPVIENMKWTDALRKFGNLSNMKQPACADAFPIEKQLDYSHLISALSGIVRKRDTIDKSIEQSLDYLIVTALSGGLYAELNNNSVGHQIAVQNQNIAPPKNAKSLEIKLTNSNLINGLQQLSYPDFGLFIFKSKHFFLSIRCGTIGQDGFGGHAHNDQLSVELNIDGKDIIKDPGVYRYTVSMKERNAYRSVMAHFTPRVGTYEPGDLNIGTWRLGDESKAMVEQLGNNFFIGSHVGYGKKIYRKVSIEKDRIIIADWGVSGLEVEDPTLLYKKINSEGCLISFCPGYGIYTNE